MILNSKVHKNLTNCRTKVAKEVDWKKFIEFHLAMFEMSFSYLLFSLFQQAFVRLALNDAEIIYVAEPDASNNYKFDLDVSAKAKEFGSKSGKYSVSLIVGDAVVSNPVNWNLADISLQFPGK